jgi:hypothetical protein
MLFFSPWNVRWASNSVAAETMLRTTAVRSLLLLALPPCLTTTAATICLCPATAGTTCPCRWIARWRCSGAHGCSVSSATAVLTRRDRNTNIEGTCIVFREWRISSTTGLLLSMAAIVALGVLYEWLRVFQGTVDRRIARRMLAAGKGKGRGPSLSGRSTPEAERSEDAGLLGGVRASLKPG